MGMIYKRGNTWEIKYYRNGKCFRERVLFEKVNFDELAEETFFLVERWALHMR